MTDTQTATAVNEREAKRDLDRAHKTALEGLPARVDALEARMAALEGRKASKTEAPPPAATPETSAPAAPEAPAAKASKAAKGKKR